MRPLTGLILRDFAPIDIEEFDDDRPAWQKTSRIPFVNFRATFLLPLSAEDVASKVKGALESQGFEVETHAVADLDVWHARVSYYAEVSRIVVVTDGDSIRVFSSIH